MNIRKAFNIKQVPGTVWFLSAVLALMLGASFNVLSSLSQNVAQKEIQLNLDEVVNLMKNNTQSVNSVRLVSDSLAIAKAHAFAYMITLKPALLKNAAEMEAIRKILNVSSLNVTNKDGITIASTDENNIGYDFSSSPRSSPFMLAIYYNKFELTQPPQIDKANNNLYQYAGVARLDQPGIVEIKYVPEKVKRILESSAIRDIAKDWSIAESGKVMIADFDGKILSTYDGNHLGESLTSYGFPEKAFEESQGEFTATVQGENRYFIYRFKNERLIIGSITEAEIYRSRDDSTIILALISILAIALALFISSRQQPKQTS